MASSAKELVGATGECEMVAEIGGGVAEVHGRDVEAGGNPLVQGGEDAEAELADQGGLTQEDACEGTAAIHVGVGEQAEFLELGSREQVCFVDHDDDAAVTLGRLGLEELLGLSHHLGFEEARDGAECADDGDVQAAGAEGGVGDLCG